MSDEPKPTKSESNPARHTPDEVIAKQRNRQLLVVSAVIVVLAALVAITRATHTTETPLKEVMLVGGTHDQPGINKDQIKRIQIWKGSEGKKFELNRDGDDWRVPTRFNAPASKDDVDSLITRILDASRLNRASSTNKDNYYAYGLSDDEAVHLRLVDDNDKELLHVMLGHPQGGTRDFVRLTGDGAPEGVFELSALGGKFETLYGALNLDSDGKPQPKSWVSTKAFDPLPLAAVAQEISIRDGDHSMTFERKPNSDPADNEWQLTAPRKGDAEGSAVRSVIDALQNYHATDIAGRAEDAKDFGLAAPGKELTLTYTDNNKPTTEHLYFGKKDDNGNIAVMAKTTDKGTYIYWAGDFILSRIFRSTPEFMHKVRINLIPDGVTPDSLKVEDGALTIGLERKVDGATTSWKMTEPLQLDADRLKVTNLLTSLNTLQGYPGANNVDHAALQLGPGQSTRSITAVYTPRQSGAKDSDDAPDTPDGEKPKGDKPADEKPKSEKPADEKPADEKPGEEKPKPKETPEPEKPSVKTAALYFGKTQQGELPVLRVIDGVEQVFWIKADVASGLFKSEADYLEQADIDLVEAGKKPAVVRVARGDAVISLSYGGGAKGDKQWHIQQPWDEMADQASADRLLHALQGLRGVKPAQPLDKKACGLGDGISKREVDLQFKDGDAASTVTLYVGERLHGMDTALVVRADGKEETWMFPPAELYPLFVSPADYRVMGAFEGKVRHILITWKGRSPGLVPKDPERTEEQAWELANDILKRAKAGEDFVELQKKYNEDSDPTHVYDVSPTAQLVKPFLRLASELKKGEVGIVESQYGIHVIKRIE